AGLAAAAAAAGVPARLGRALLASDDRWDIYRITLRALLDRPLLGHGHGGYPHLFHLYADPTLSHIVFDRAHSTYLELAVELGLPAALLLLAALAAPAVLCWRAWRADPAAARPAALALAATLLAALHSAIDFSLQTPAAAVAYAALLGAGASCYRPARPQR
ncbi:MAG TPA: O-antigen ligase family protein, partial [Alphaproteobacteria bacterium]|nr:O-antigen ligase family protein [Alphaproteobacteria bacterium]